MCLSWANSIFHSCMKTYSILSMVFWKEEKIWKEMLAIKCPPLNSQIPFLFIFSSVNKCGGLNENFPTSSYFNTQSSLGGAVKRDIAAFLEEVCHWGPPKRVHDLIILALRYLFFSCGWKCNHSASCTAMLGTCCHSPLSSWNHIPPEPWIRMNSFSPKLLLVMVFYPSNREVSSIVADKAGVLPVEFVKYYPQGVVDHKSCCTQADINKARNYNIYMEEREVF